MTKKKLELESGWALDEDGHFRPLKALIQSHIAPGLYELLATPPTEFMPGTIELKPLEAVTDKLLTLPGSLTEYIVRTAEEFWMKGDEYKAMGLVHKRGLMLEGKPGTGKTAICLLAGQEIGKRGGIAIFVGPNTLINMLPRLLEHIRECEAELPITVIFEDIDKHIPEITPHTSGTADANSRANMTLLLSLLDGEKQIQKVMYIATTNYFEKIDDRLTNRPSRFDEIIKAKPLGKKARRAYFESIVPPTYDKINALVEGSRGLNFAHMKELAICSVIYKRDIEKTAERLKNLAENRSTGFAETEED